MASSIACQAYKVMVVETSFEVCLIYILYSFLQCHYTLGIILICFDAFYPFAYGNVQNKSAICKHVYAHCSLDETCPMKD